MGWRGRSYPGEWPTLGYQVIDWIEDHLVVPDGPLVGEPFTLTDEQQRFVLAHYRLDLAGRFVYRGSQLMRSQKWGKSPLIAAVSAAEALGPVLFSHWDEHGEPVGVPWATPWIQVAAVSEEQTANIFRPLFTMLAEGPLSDPDDPRYCEGLDVGETRVNLPGGGRIEPVTSQAKSRLGARLTFSPMDETHLWTESSGGHDLAATMKRNLAGMGGRFVEVTNAYDPSENSVGQRTHTSGAKDIRLDWRPCPDPTVSLENRAELKKALRYCYGDSRWVDLDRIVAEVRDPTTSPADAKRYFLSLIVVGDKDFLDPIAWDAQARPGESLAAGERVTLGFDGSKRQDATSLVACRISDGRLFKLRTWARPINAPADWRVPTVEVDQVMQATFAAYDVWYLFADPFRWQDYLDAWDAKWPKRIVQFETNQERRMDQALERFLTAFRAGEITHDGDPTMTAHVRAAALARGKRKQARDDTPEGGGLSQFYLRLVKKKGGKIDDTIAMVLAYEARGHAVADGALVDTAYDPLASVW